MFSDKDDIILAKGVNVNRKADKNVNVLVYGSEKDGKYESYIFPNIQNLLGNYIIIDTNDKIFNLTNEYMTKNGYNVVKYDISDYNPFDYVSLDIDVSLLSNSIIKNSSVHIHNYHDEKSLDTFFKIIIYYALSINNEKISLIHCEMILNDLKDGNLSLQKVLDSIDKKIVVDDYKNTLDKLSIDEINDIICDLTKILKDLEDNNISQSTDISLKGTLTNINLYEVCMQKSILYLKPSQKSYLNSMFFTQLIEQLFLIAEKHYGRLPYYTLLILDNFENLGFIYNYDIMISTSRSRGISHSLIIDDWFKFKNLYNEKWNIIMGNIGSGVFLRNLNSTSKNVLQISDGNFFNITNTELPPNKCIVYKKEKPLEIKEKYHKKNKFEKYSRLQNHTIKELSSDNMESKNST